MGGCEQNITLVDYDLDRVIKQLKEIGTQYCKSVGCDRNCSDCDHASLMRAVLQIVKGG